MHTSEEGLVNSRGLAKNVGTSVTLENHLTFDVLSSAANLHNYSWTLLGDVKKAQKQASEQKKVLTTVRQNALHYLVKSEENFRR